MSKIAFFCIPAYGHTNPTIGVVKKLMADGHQVRYYSYEHMRARIQESGAQFIPCDQFDPQLKMTREESEKLVDNLELSVNLIVDMTLALDDALLADMREYKPDVIVGDSMAFWAKLIARKLNIPFISSTTTFAFNKHSAKLMKQGGGSLLSMFASMPKVNKSLKKLRAKGYNVKNFLDIIANDNDTTTIVYTAEEFQPCRETFSDKYHFVGASLLPASEKLEKTAQKTVYISLGTVINHKPEFYKMCIEALKDTDYRVIISAGTDTDIAAFEPLPANITVLPQVDQIAVLAVSDVFITHCGMNSVNEAMYFGVPLVMMPHTREQEGVARHVSNLKAGIYLHNTSPAGIRDVIDKVLTDSCYKESAAKLSAAFKKYDGASAAADVIEKVAAN